MSTILFVLACVVGSFIVLGPIALLLKIAIDGDKRRGPRS